MRDPLKLVWIWVCVFCLVACAKRDPILVIKPDQTKELVATKTIATIPVEPSGLEPRFVVGDTEFLLAAISGEATALAAADVNQDGDLDLVLAKEPEITILLGDGQGEFQHFSRVDAGQQPDDMAIADINGDGAVDILVANHDTQHLTILLGNGRGSFLPAQNSPLQIDVKPHPHAVRTADLDGDGFLELVIDHRVGEGLLILRGLGGGHFETPGVLVEVGGDPYRGMAIGDIDEDGKPDLLTPNPGEIGVLINRSKDEIAFTPAPVVPADTPFAVGLGDFNGDSSLDLLSASGEGSTRIELFLGDGSGSFEGSENLSFQLARGGKNLVIGDFNGDQIQDAAIASYHASDVLVLIGGQGGFETGYLPVSQHPWGLAAGDLNGDGRDDLVVADDASSQLQIFLTGTW